MVRSLLILVALAALVAGPAQAQGQEPTPDRAAASGRIVNLNSATSAELESLPGIGPATASRILEYRQKNGPFRKIEEVMNVQGVGEKIFLRIRSQLSVGTAATPAAR
jgi:competence protein ComEA